MMMTTKTGLLRGATIELESAVPEMDGQRVRVVLEPVEEQRLSAQQQREFWQAWVERRPEGPIEDIRNNQMNEVHSFDDFTA